MSITLRENETMKDVVERLGFASEWVYEIAPIAYWYENLHENGRIKDIHFSRRMREMLGYKSVEEFPDELDTLMTFTHPEDIHAMLDDAIAAATGKIDKYDVRYRIRKADGSYMWCNATGQQVKDHNGVIIGMYGAFIDVSQEITSQALSEVLQNEGVFLIDCVNDTRKTFHDRLSGAANYKDSENYSAAFGKYVENFVCEPDYGKMKAFVDPMNMLKLLGDDKEARVQYRDKTTGTQRFYEMRIVRFSDTEVLQSFTEIDGTMLDHMLLGKLKDNYFALFGVDLETDLVRSFKTDPLNIVGGEGNISCFSSAMLELSSFFEGETKAFFERNSSVEHLREKFAQDDKAEYVYKSTQSENKWATVTGTVLKRNDDGVPVLFCLGFGYLDDDASKLLDMQEQLYTEAQRNELFFDTFDAGRWVYQVSADDEIIEGNTNIMDKLARIHPDDRESVLSQFKAAIHDHSGKTPYDVDFRITGYDGNIHWTKSAGRVIRRKDGSGEFFGMNIDITDEVKEQEEHLAQKLLADQFMSNFTKDYGIVFKVNIDDYSCTLLKTDERMRLNNLDFSHFSQVIHYLVNDITYEPDRARVYNSLAPDIIKRRLAENGTYSIEYRTLADGRTRWDKMTATVLDDTYVAVGFAARNNEIILSHLQEREYDNYYALFSIDLDAAQITMLKNDSRYATGEVGSVAPYNIVMTQFANSLKGEARDFFLQMSDIDKVRAIHDTENKLTYVYQSVMDDEPRWIRATSYAVIRHEDGTPAVATLGFNIMDSMGTQRQEMQEELARMTVVANYFVKSYSSAYYCDIRNGEVVILHANPILMEKAAGGESNFYNLLSIYVRDFVHPEDRAIATANLDADYIRRQLETAEDFNFTIRVIGLNEPGIYRCTVIRGADVNHVGIGFRNVTEEIKQEKTLQRIEGLVKTFASEYEAVFIANLTDDSYRSDSSVKEISDIFDGKGSFVEASERYFAAMMHPRDKERVMAERIPLIKTGEGLAVGESHSLEYRSKTEDGYSWYRTTLNRVSDDMVLIGFKNIDEEKLSQLIENQIIGEFDALYMVNLDADEIRPVRASRVSSVGAISEKMVYSELCRHFAQTVSPQYRRDWLRFSDVAYMKQYMAELDRREYVYELPEAGKSMRRFTINVIERVNGEAAILMLSFTGIDDFRAQSIILERKMAEQSAFTMYFLEPYESAYYIGLTDLAWQVYKRSETLERDYPTHENYIESLSKYINNEVHPEDRETVSLLVNPEALGSKLREQPSFSFTFRKISSPKEQIYRCEVIRGADEDHVAFGFRNITDEIEEQEKRQFELKEALENAQIASKAKTDFLFNMSHDIRTPMNAIIGFTNMAMKHIDDRDRVIDSLTKTQDASELLLSLINDILDMSRIESGKIKLDESEGDVYMSFVNIETTMRELARTKNINLNFEFSGITDRYVYADFSRCIRVFVNIITNAIKYTGEGGRVNIRCEQTGREDGRGIYKYTFEDNGIGMSKEFQKHVFEEFTREETATVSGIQGTGLGLAVCKSFVSAMSGTIECESTQGVGSIFTVVLPFRIQEGQLFTNPINGQVISGLPAEASKGPVDFSGCKVLLVEDNEMNREIAEDILSEEGMLVESASDGSVAVDILREKGPDYYDFILMDIQMPIMNGYEATKAIREMYPKSRIPIVALSANAFEEDKIASITAGMNDHVAKPINIGELKATLTKYL